MQPDELEFWIDMNLPPAMAIWIQDEFNMKAKTFSDLGFSDAADAFIFKAAKKQKNVIVITTKDIDFVFLEQEIGAPPKILYINTGNITNKELHLVISKSFHNVIITFTKTNQTILEITNFL